MPINWLTANALAPKTASSRTNSCCQGRVITLCPPILDYTRENLQSERQNVGVSLDLLADRCIAH
jgi:hypothetical protein